MDSSALVAWVAEDFTLRATLVFAVMILFASGLPLGLAWFLWRAGSCTQAFRLYPPKGFRLLRDAPRLTGRAAELRGRAMKVFSAIIAGMALLIAMLLVRFALTVWGI